LKFSCPITKEMAPPDDVDQEIHTVKSRIASMDAVGKDVGPLYNYLASLQLEKSRRDAGTV